MLGDFTVNNHNITQQMMRKFLTNSQLTHSTWSTEVMEDLETCLPKTEQNRGTLRSVCSEIENQHSVSHANNLDGISFFLLIDDCEMIRLPERRIKKQLSETEYRLLSSMITKLGREEAGAKLLHQVESMDSLLFRGEPLQIDRKDKVNCNIVQAKWLKRGFNHQISPCEKFARSGSISQILSTQHRTAEGVMKYLIILKIDWFSWYEQPHVLGQSMDVYHKHFVGEGDYSYMPIQRVICKCATHVIKHNNIDLRVTIPLLGKWGM